MPQDFPIGVWYQPVSSFPKWQSRGINFLMGYESEGNTVSYSTWKAAAVAHGMKYIVQLKSQGSAAVPGPLSGADNSDPNLLAIILPDEPDGAGNLSPGQILDMYNAAKTMCPSKPVFTNWDGWKTQWRPFNDYRCYAIGSDWIGMDYYPFNRGEANATAPNLGMSMFASRLDFVKQAGGSAGGAKKYFAAIECSDQGMRVQGWMQDPANAINGQLRSAVSRGPTINEMSKQIALAVSKGYNGIFYFPDDIGNGFNGFDSTPTDVANAMTGINDYLRNL